MHKSTLKELLVLAYPMVISQGAFAVMIFTDRYFMSMVSPSHMAASLGGGVAAFFCGLSFSASPFRRSLRLDASEDVIVKPWVR